jgi:hypothetical protein
MFDGINDTSGKSARIGADLITVDAPLDQGAYRRALATIAERRLDGLLVSTETELVPGARTIVEFAKQAHLPAMYGLNLDFSYAAIFGSVN